MIEVRTSRSARAVREYSSVMAPLLCCTGWAPDRPGSPPKCDQWTAPAGGATSASPATIANPTNRPRRLMRRSIRPGLRAGADLLADHAARTAGLHGDAVQAVRRLHRP